MSPEWVGREIHHLFRALAVASRILWAAKIGLGIFALLLLLMLIIWPLGHSLNQKLKMTFKNIPTGAAKTPTMVNPQFHGIDRNGRPYTIIADTAVQNDQNVMNLVNVNGEMSFNDGWMSLLSDRGELNMEKKTAELHDSVDLLSNSGYEFITDRAHVDMGKSTANGDDPVKIQGPLGTLNATGFSSNGKTNMIHFKGPIEAILYPKQRDSQ